MATASTPQSLPEFSGAVPLLRAGQRLSQSEFHRRYEFYPDPDVKFELIGGTVHMMAPAGFEHSRRGFEICSILSLYEAATPGVTGVVGATVVLGEASEPQPDLALLIDPVCGGQTRLKQIKDKQYIHGPPELVIEISHSTLKLDSREKKDDYLHAGVQEYMIVAVEEREVRWFDLSVDETFSEDSSGIIKSRVFPGLWIDTAALLNRDMKRLVGSLQRGLRTKAHSQFVQELAALSSKSAPPHKPSTGDE
jgi:Uma2 family endonuclease